MCTKWVVAAITYQIIPADTQYAEVPLAAVSSIYQQKGVGRLTYMELRKRLQNVGICSIFCWGDKESEGFWLKQGFVSVGEVNTKGRARKLPIKADIRRALCLPGGSTLMVSHLKTENPVNITDSVMLSFLLKPLQKLPPSEVVQNQEIGGITQRYDSPKAVNQKTDGTVDAQPKEMLKDNFLTDGCRDVACLKGFESGNSVNNLEISQFGADSEKHFFCSALGSRKRTWEASCTSLQSKKVKGGYLKDCQLNSSDHVSGSNGANNCCLERNSQAISRTKPLEEFTPRDPLCCSILEMNPHEYRPGNITSEDNGCEELLSRRDGFRIMLMNIADDAKKSNLTKIIEELGGTVTSDGGLCTHVVTGKVRKTLNFCTALCSGAWIISPSWLKESFQKRRFVDYELKYRSELKNVIRRARIYPRALLKGYDICLAAHVQPPISTFSAIVRIAGGNVICDLNKVTIPQKTIFVASEEDMEEALSAVKKGLWTFSNDWLINCIMRQELDLDAPQFAESL